ncbi:succinylglutamate desuccinylase/aspartoacylase family protein [Oricola cellulosilytica]|uniref:Succinylglutamate desuccinylase/aspartoacylase family protein n=1 Tax=Oricola cellulosilytica TaxID=1429082 RepID=A0A4R0PED5_9HYPH|nr:succinylglutamate desuccinylase/aspartoacylase family protein [Oricola cellulosilytica]TCD14555.1 succinylglutamate desuccinylase/aspartoacylase family protein [Oricola cellulosilytica]
MLQKNQREPFEIADTVIGPGQRATIGISLGMLSNHVPMELPIRVIHGKRPGPTFFVSAAVHGDEILGIEIIRRVLQSPLMEKLRGTLIAVPIVNGPGFIAHSRYLPDRRDLNRSFPGSERGSMAARLADTFLREIVLRCETGIDLHTAALHRTNFPQLRFDNSATERLRALADAFGAPVTIESSLRTGSLRETAKRNGVEMLLYEAGEALRFDEFSIRIGVRGVMSVMQQLGMFPAKSVSPPRRKPVRSKSSYWVRAPEGGILRMNRTTGDLVETGEAIAVLSDPFGEYEVTITAEAAGVIIGRTNLPTVNMGDALFHIARTGRLAQAGGKIEAITDEMDSHPLFDEDEVI